MWLSTWAWWFRGLGTSRTPGDLSDGHPTCCHTHRPVPMQQHRPWPPRPARVTQCPGAGTWTWPYAVAGSSSARTSGTAWLW